MLLVHKPASVWLHRALLSRVAVINSGFFKDKGSGGKSKLLSHEELKMHYDSRYKNSTSSLKCDEDLEEESETAKERRLLSCTEMSLSDLVQHQGTHKIDDNRLV